MEKINIKRMAFLFAVLAPIYYLVWGMLADMKNTASFGGDTWEYQSMGVNFAKGHGIQKFGAMEPFDTYKFEQLDPIPDYFNDFFTNAGNFDFLRAPAYPLFLGIVYTFSGISPGVVKALQLLMLVIIAASLPLIGNHYWGKSGFIGGIPAGALYLATNYKLAEYILDESLIAFAVFLFLVAFIIYEQRQSMLTRTQSILTACVFGISMGFALLVKGSLIFLPIFTWSVFLVNIVKKRNSENWKFLLVIILSAGLTILPWFMYVNAKSGNFNILSTQATQGTTQILDDNNELCVDGGWHPEWVEDQNAFYNTDGIDKNRVVVKVLNFYWHHPALLPRCMFQKFLKGFGPLPFLWIFVGFMLINEGLKILGRRMKSEFIHRLTDQFVPKIPISFWVVGGNFLLITLLFHGEASIVRSRLVAPMDFVFILLCCVAAVRLFSILYRILHKKPAGL